MKYAITYELKTAYGNKSIKTAYAYTKSEAEEICNSIEKLGYKILDFSYADIHYGM